MKNTPLPISDFLAQSILISVPVKAGFPSPALDYSADPINLNAELIKNPSSTFIFNCEGDSMMPVIPEHAMLIVDRALTVRNNSIVLAVIDGEFTVKFYKKEGIKPALVPANRKYKPIPIEEYSDCTVWGVVTKIIIDAVNL